MVRPESAMVTVIDSVGVLGGSAFLGPAEGFSAGHFKAAVVVVEDKLLLGRLAEVASSTAVIRRTPWMVFKR